MNKSKFVQGLGIVISLAVVALLVRSLQISRVAEALAEADYWWLLPAVAVSLTSFIWRAQRFRIYLLSLHFFSLLRSYGYIAINYMGNAVLPARAGEVLLSYVVLKEESIPISSSLAVTILGRVIDGLWLLLLLMAGLLFLHFPLWVDQVLVAGLVLFSLALLGLVWLVFGSPSQHRRLHLWTASFMPEVLEKWLMALAEQVKHFQQGLQALKRPSIVGQSLLLTVAIWLCEGAVYMLVGQAMHIHIEIWQWIFVLALANVTASIPSGPAGIGTFEGVIIVALGLAGIPTHQAAAYALLLHVTQVVPITIIGALSYAKLSLKPSTT